MSYPALPEPDLPGCHYSVEHTAKQVPYFFFTLFAACLLTPLVMLVSKAPVIQLLLCALATTTVAIIMLWQTRMANRMRKDFPHENGATKKLAALLSIALGSIILYGIIDLSLTIAFGYNTMTFGVAAILVVAGVAKPTSDMLRVAMNLSKAEQIYGKDGAVQLWHFQAYRRSRPFEPQQTPPPMHP